jgi:hypothetical protein
MAVRLLPLFGLVAVSDSDCPAINTSMLTLRNRCHEPRENKNRQASQG